MSKLNNRLKLAWLKSVEVIGTGASNLASNAKHKAAEITLETRRREIMTEFSLLALDLWQKGEQLPKPLDDLLVELTDIDERLSVLRAQKYATVGGEEKAGGEPQAETPAAQAEPNGDEDTVAQEPAPMESEDQASSSAGSDEEAGK